MMNDADEAAQEGVDPDRRLPGEPEDSSDLEEAVKWAEVYEDLLAFKRHMLDTLRADLRYRRPEARREIEETDLVIMEAEAERLERRRDLWRGRLG
jgi:hypothetical protein